MQCLAGNQTSVLIRDDFPFLSELEVVKDAHQYEVSGKVYVSKSSAQTFITKFLSTRVEPRFVKFEMGGGILYYNGRESEMQKKVKICKIFSSTQ